MTNELFIVRVIATAALERRETDFGYPSESSQSQSEKGRNGFLVFRGAKTHSKAKNKSVCRGKNKRLPQKIRSCNFSGCYTFGEDIATTSRTKRRLYMRCQGVELFVRMFRVFL